MTGEAAMPQVLVVGAGAIGGYFGALLTLGPCQVTFVARGAHAQAVADHGMRIESGPDEGTYPVNVVSDAADAPPPDLVLLGVKTYDTGAACEALRSVLQPSSVVLELQNGVGRASVVDQMLGGQHTLVGVVYMESALEAPGVVRYLSGARKIVAGEQHGPPGERVQALSQLLTAAGIVHEIPADVRPQAWRKFALVCAANGLTGLTGGSFGEILASSLGPQVVRQILQEVVAVATAEGVDLGNSFTDESLAFLTAMGPALKSSMLRDVERGRQTEVDALNGTVVALAQRHHLPAAANSVITLALGMRGARVKKEAD